MRSQSQSNHGAARFTRAGPSRKRVRVAKFLGNPVATKGFSIGFQVIRLATYAGKSRKPYKQRLKFNYEFAPEPDGAFWRFIGVLVGLRGCQTGVVFSHFAHGGAVDLDVMERERVIRDVKVAIDSLGVGGSWKSGASWLKDFTGHLKVMGSSL